MVRARVKFRASFSIWHLGLEPTRTPWPPYLHGLAVWLLSKLETFTDRVQKHPLPWPIRAQGEARVTVGKDNMVPAFGIKISSVSKSGLGYLFVPARSEGGGEVWLRPRPAILFLLRVPPALLPSSVLPWKWRYGAAWWS